MSFEDEYAGKYSRKKESPLKPFYPVIGLLILIIAGAAAYFGSDVLAPILRDQLSGSLGTASPGDVRLIAGAAIFGMIVTLFALLYAIAAPKPKNRNLVSEKQLLQEREDREREKKSARRRKRQMIEKMRDKNEEF